MTAKDQALQDLDRHDVRAGQRWQHFKGAVYTVVAVGIDEPTMNPVVIYAGHDGVVWVRTLMEWTRMAKPGVPRFQRLEDEALELPRFARGTAVTPTSTSRGGRFL